MKQAIQGMMGGAIVFLAQESRAEDIRDVQPPVDLPTQTWLLYTVLALVFIGLIVLLFKWIRVINQRPKKKVEVIKQPWGIALEQLEQLARRNLIAQGHIKAYYSELSDIIRTYFENQYSIRAPEMTSEEFLNSLKNSQKLSSIQKNALAQFLNSCDMVKFAKYAPQAEESEKSYQLARGLIYETKETIPQGPSVK